MSEYTYPISQEIVDMFVEADANEACRDSCLHKIFGWKRAAYFAKKELEVRRAAWEAVHAIYPELKGSVF